MQVDRDFGKVARARALDTFLVWSASPQVGALVLVGNPWVYVFAFSYLATVVSFYEPYSIRYCLLCISEGEIGPYDL